MNIEKSISYQEYITRENDEFHAPYKEEFNYYNAVQMGNVKQVEQLLKENPLNKKQGLGTLSKNPLQNLKYHFTISAAMVARYCIDAGMTHETAYLLSDYYIEKADTIQNDEALTELLSVMMMDYTNRMAALRYQNVLSKEIRLCLDYIYKNLHTKIYLDDLAHLVQLNASHLSRKFKHEMGMTIRSYIMQVKLDTAKNMLLYSEYNIVEIAHILNFSSQSHFTEAFRLQYGDTPSNYIKKGAY